jgi:NADPH-dependent 2,4-dienoyl-CoA reductase/sulfur reductase-like enzyme
VSDRVEARVLVVGAGPAGIAAAVHAAEAGSGVLLVDESQHAGGQVWRHTGGEPPAAARPWLERLARAGARRLAATGIVDVTGEGGLLAERDGQPVELRCERLVLATGARELFLPFPGWTLPGVVGAGGAQALLKAGARVRGLRAVVAGSGPLLVAVAAGLAQAGARIVAIVEQAPIARVTAFGLLAGPAKAKEALGYARQLGAVRYRTGAWVRAAHGGQAIERVTVSDGRREWPIDCDLLACGFGLVPNLELARLLGCATTADAVRVDDAQRTSLPWVHAAGELVGIGGLDQALATGAAAGLAAADRPLPDSLRAARERARAFAGRMARAFALRPGLRALARPETLVCRCEDVPLARVAACSGAREARLAARVGMGACQGRVCTPALGFLLGWSAGTIRPPLSPTPVGLLASARGDGAAQEEAS